MLITKDFIQSYATLYKRDLDQLYDQVTTHITRLPFEPMKHEVVKIIVSYCTTNQPPQRDKIFERSSHRDRVHYLNKMDRRKRTVQMHERGLYDERSSEMAD